jgi:hypothetical protein
MARRRDPARLDAQDLATRCVAAMSNSGSSLRMCSISGSRPRLHVAMTEKITAPVTSGNQPPCMIFSEQDTTGKTPASRLQEGDGLKWIQRLENSGLLHHLQRPITPSTTNQTVMIGPKSLPTAPVPNRCTMNRTTMMATSPTPHR